MHASVFKKLSGWLVGVAMCAVLMGCFDAPPTESPKERQAKAMEMWRERCKKSGEFIHRTADNVEGIYLMKVRPSSINFDDQFKMDDPYGRDLGGEDYVQSFLRGSYQAGRKDLSHRPQDPPRLGYLYVEAVDSVDGKRYRYTGGMRATRKKDITAPGVQFELRRDPDYDLNIYDFVIDKASAEACSTLVDTGLIGLGAFVHGRGLVA